MYNLWFIDIIPLLIEDGWSIHLINLMLFLIITALSWVVYVLFKNFWELTERIAKKWKAKIKYDNAIIEVYSESKAYTFYRKS